MKRYEIGPLTTNLANSINLSVLLLILSIVSGEMQTFLASGALNSLAIMGYITAASLSGVLISFALIMCSLVASPLATSVTGAVKVSLKKAIGFSLKFGGVCERRDSAVSAGSGGLRVIDWRRAWVQSGADAGAWRGEGERRVMDGD